MLPKISIITPSYNQAEYLERTILSVLNQDYPNLEYIIIDGGSDDGTLDIIGKYSNHITCWISEPDSGQSEALNKGFKMASGEIIGWLNSDDLYCSNALHTAAATLTENPEADACFGGIFIIDRNNRILNAVWPVEPDPAYNFHVGLSLHQQGLFWRRSLFPRIGLIDESLEFAMDLDFIIRILLEGRLIRVEKHMGMFRLHEVSKTSTLQTKSYLEHMKINERYRADFPIYRHLHLKKYQMRMVHILKVIRDAPASYLCFKLQCLLTGYGTPRWKYE